MLVAYEDKRFCDHAGVDLLALLRAAGAVRHQRPHRLGRLDAVDAARPPDRAAREPQLRRRSSGRSFRAVQIERRLTKREILERYLTLAPYGGNLEGVRAASLAYFGKEPKRLDRRRRPPCWSRCRNCRNGAGPTAIRAGAQAARDRVLARMVDAGLLGEREAARAALDDGARPSRRALPALAAQLADAALRSRPGETTPPADASRKSVQAGLEAVAREARARSSAPSVSVAMVLADAMTGEILGEVGSADYFDASRSGWIDMTRDAALARLDAEALHLRPRLRGGPDRAGDA